MTTRLLSTIRLSAFGMTEPRADGLRLSPAASDNSAVSIYGSWKSVPWGVPGAANHAATRRELPGFSASRRTTTGRIPIAHRSL